MSARRAAIAAVAAIAVFTTSAAPAAARVDRKAPSKPTNPWGWYSGSASGVHPQASAWRNAASESSKV